MLPRSVAPQSPVPDAGLDQPGLYFNRELGWLDFNWRVLSQARDPELPLLERVRFVAIAGSNLDEFFQKRVGGLKRQKIAGVSSLSLDGRSVTEQLRVIQDAAGAMLASITAVWEHELVPALAEHAGVVAARYSELASGPREALDRHFREHIYPILTPLAVDPGHPFPLISNLSLSLAVLLRHPQLGSTYFARVKVPTRKGRWLPLPGDESPHHYVAVDDVVRNNVHQLFPGMEVQSAHLFRITRNADIRRGDEDAEDLLALISEELRERRFAPVVRLEIEQGMPAEVRELLVRELELEGGDEFEVDGLLGVADCAEFADLDLPAHRSTPWEPVVPPNLQRAGDAEDPSIFSVLAAGDVLVHHPYDSFAATVQRLVEEAADDPHVLAIKQTLYRTSDNSPIIRALTRAAEKGKLVAVLVEVTARFDEERNIEWAQALEDAGVHVTYGLVGLKTHAKVVLVVRDEGGPPQTYCHIGTGNYHPRTARLYTDVGLLTRDRDIGCDLVNLFHFLTGHAPDQKYGDLIVAPRDLRRWFIERIRREAEIARQGRPARILWKMNALDDPGIMRELYAASRRGVSIDLIVRSHSQLRPGLPGFSETIRVRSIIGRFLEHDRIYAFHNDGDPQVHIGSADCRERNLDRRVEALVPVRQPALRDRLLEILELALRDNTRAWELRADGSYVRVAPREGEPAVDLHEELMRDASRRAGSAPYAWELRGEATETGPRA